MMHVIHNPLTSVSDLKKSPMKIIELSKVSGDAVYILNNNKDVGVIVDSDHYKTLVERNVQLTNEVSELSDRIAYLEAELRLLTNDQVYTDEEVRGTETIQADLSAVADEWA